MIYHKTNNGILYKGDCLELMPTLTGQVDMILCDLPYGTTACKWDTVIPFEPLWEQYKRLIKPNGAIVLTASQPFTSALVMSNLSMFKYELIWNKLQGKQPMLAKIRPMKSHENILVFSGGKTRYNPQFNDGAPYYDKRNKTNSSVHRGTTRAGYEMNNTGFRYPLSIVNSKSVNTAGQHPTQKPVALFEYLIKTYTNEGEVVLDNCMGSGTTAVACENLGRKWIGMEQEEKYCDVIKSRLIVHTPIQSSLFECPHLSDCETNNG